MAAGRLLSNLLLSVTIVTFLSLILDTKLVHYPTKKVSSVSMYINLDVHYYVKRNSDLHRRYRSYRSTKVTKTMSFHRAKNGIYLIKYLMAATYLLLLAGDINMNPGPGTYISNDAFKSTNCGEGLSICQWNVQCLTDSKFEEISSSLNSVQHSRNKADIVILTETFATSKKPDSLFAIANYDLYRRDRVGKKGGGIFIYVSNQLKCTKRNDLMSPDCEVLWLEVCPYKSKRHLLIAGVYRPPSSQLQDDIYIGSNIENAYLLNMEMIILGDFNIDILKPNYSKHKLIKTLKHLHLTQLLNQVTRPASKTCLDHIWTTNPERISTVETKLIGLSDHLPTIALRKYNKEGIKDPSIHKSFNYRDFKHFDVKAFIQSLNEAPWDTAFIFSEIDDIYDAWFKIFTGIIDDCAPVKQKRIKKSVQPAWFTSELNKLIVERNNLLKKAKRSGTDTDAWNKYKKCKNSVTKAIRLAKKEYFQNQVKDNRNNPKKLWSLIKTLTRENVNNHVNINSLKDKNGISHDEKGQLVEMLNSFFVNQPRELLGTSSSPTTGPSNNINCSNSAKPLVIPYITKGEIEKSILSMPSNKASGADGLSVKILKAAAPAISSSLARLINHCIDNGCVPSAWKLAKVIPIYKGKGSRDDMSNYRPISVLPILSKIFEKHVHSATFSHLKENNLLYKLQSGFRRNHSTETALVRMIDQLLLSLEDDHISGLLLIDYKKAFDLVDHEILLTKLKSYNIESKELKLFRNYLKDRHQYVKLGQHTSDPKTITHGVPQGSILGPLLFLVFINDLPNIVNKSTVDIFADDTTICASAPVASCTVSLKDTLQSDLNQVTEWSTNNSMIVNSTKTKVVLITGQRLDKKLEDRNLTLIAHGSVIDQPTSEKLLGVRIDEKLKFDDHVEDLSKKLSQRIGVLKNIKRNLPLNERKLFYNAMIKPIMLYGSTVWGSSTNIDKIFKLQKRAARVILDADLKERTNVMFSKLKWIPIKDEISIRKCSLIYKRNNGLTPTYINDMLIRNSDVHTRSTRHSGYNLVCPKYKRECEGGRTFRVTSTKLWNTIPTEIKKKPSFQAFKSAIRKYFYTKN